MVKSKSGKLMTATGGKDTKVYFVYNEVKRWVTNEETVLSLGFNWNDLIYVDPGILAEMRTAEPMASASQKVYDAGDAIYCIEKTWSDNFNIGITGWAIGKKKPLKSLTISIDDASRKISDWTERPEIYEHFDTHTDFAPQKACGFSVVLHRVAEQQFTFKAGLDGKKQQLNYERSKHITYGSIPMDKQLDKRFQDLINKNELSVLEVGSRVSPGGTNKRGNFKMASKYVGFDYHDGDLVDVVGDAHKLSTYFTEKFDALYSDSVLEHLAAPWQAVIEMNKVLKKGAYVYHSTPSCWVLHDMPWDFWRFSDAGLKSLFSEAFGFKVLGVEYMSPMSVHLDDEVGDEYAKIPLSPAYGFVAILAQKVHDIDSASTRFTHTIDELVDKDTSYPLWDK